MRIYVVLKNGDERTVSKAEFQFLMATRQVMFFKRKQGWVVPGRDRTRQQSKSFDGKDRREPSPFLLTQWY